MWANSSDSASNSRLGYWLGIYGALSVVEGAALALATLYVSSPIPPSALDAH